MTVGIFQFHQGLSTAKLSGERNDDQISFNSIKDYQVLKRSIVIEAYDAFNSIKDYLIIFKKPVSGFVDTFFQFHQGLSPIYTPGDNNGIHTLSFNSIKDYLTATTRRSNTCFDIFQFHQGLSKRPSLFNALSIRDFQFHQGLSEYFYTLTTLLYLLPLI